ncbi:unnamed protein product [Urochloa humidicola]
MGRRRSGRRRAAVIDSPADLSGRSTADQQKSSSSGGSTVTSLSQQTVEESPPPQLRPPQDTADLRRRLLGLIRGFYLDAISRLPTADLRATTLARGLLLGGHCFGPLHPVHNIITNSVWYAAAFPLHPADRTTENFREEGISMCCLVEPSPGYTDNCHACLRHERKISHPVVGPVYHSHILHFGEQCSEIGTLHHDWDFRPILGVDYLCFDSDRDNGLVELLRDFFARIDAYCSYQSDDEK